MCGYHCDAVSRVETTLREMRDLGLRRPPALVFHEYDFVCLTRNCLCLGPRWNFAVPMYILIVTNSFLERRLVWRRRYGFRTDLTNFPLVIITKNYDGPAQGYTSRLRRMRAHSTIRFRLFEFRLVALRPSARKAPMQLHVCGGRSYGSGRL